MLAEFQAAIFPPKVEIAQPAPQPVSLEDDELLRRMFAARNGAAIEALYRGDTGAHQGDDSAADEALCFHLAWWTRDASQIDRLVRRSGLYREKWERADYRERTIERALKGVSGGYEPRRNGPTATETPAEAKGPPIASAALIDWGIFWNKDRRAEDWLCEPILPRGRAVATYSPAKTGKSLVALGVAARLATGQRAFDQPAGEPVHVVYLDLEMTEDDLAERLEDMGYGPDSDLSHLHYYLLPTLPALDTPEGGEALLAIALFHKAALIIIDTTSRVLGGKENDSDTLRAYHLFTGLRLKAAGFTVWRLDHAGKDLARGQRGTSAKADDVDLVWELTAREDGLRLRATHRRQSWIPETVDFVLLDDPLRHERAAESWPAGTKEMAATLDACGAPISASSREATSVLKQAGKQARRTVLLAALRYRKEAGNHPGNHPLNPNGNHRPEPPTSQPHGTLCRMRYEGSRAEGRQGVSEQRIRFRVRGR